MLATGLALLVFLYVVGATFVRVVLASFVATGVLGFLLFDDQLVYTLLNVSDQLLLFAGAAEVIVALK